MFKTRLISGIVLVALALALIITGGNILLTSTAVIALIGMFELYRIFHIERTIAGIAGFLAAVLFYCNLKFAFIPDTMMFVIGFLVVLMFIYVFSYPKYHTEQMLAAFFGVFYVAVMLSYIYQTRMLPQGAYTVWLIFLCSWGCSFIHLLASMAIRYRHDFLFCPVMGRRSRTDLMDLPQEVPKPYPRNQKESERIKRIQIIKRKECAYPTTLSTLFPFTFLCTCT